MLGLYSTHGEKLLRRRRMRDESLQGYQDKTHSILFRGMIRGMISEETIPNKNALWKCQSHSKVQLEKEFKTPRINEP